MQLKLILQSAIKDHNLSSIDARILLQSAASLTIEQIYLYPNLEIDNAVVDKFWQLVERRKNNEPVAKIIGSKDFWKSSFIVSNHTLDPRPDSEVIIAAALELLLQKPYSFLDLGTGTGCLILSLLQEFPQAKAIACDISPQALKIAKTNAENLGLSERIEFLQNNWADGLKQKFDLIVSNPPYIPTKDIEDLSSDVKNYDPMLALDGGEDGLAPYRYLADQILDLLNPCAYAILEFGFNQSELVEEIFEKKGYKIHKIIKDLNNIKRAIIIGV